MVTIEVLAGSPSRGTELTCIQLQNISCRTHGIYNIGRHMAIVVQYSKTSSRNGHDTLIPHILDAFCQDVIKTVTFVTYPFAEQMSQILYPDRDDITTLWHNHLFVKKDTLFTTKDISSVLQHASLETMQIKLGIQDYRQLSICVRCAHCPTLEELIGMWEDVNVAAQQAGHSGATEERMYGISTGYLGYLPENLIEPYANVSAEWQVLMKVPEGGKNVYMHQYSNKELWTPLLSPDKSPVLHQYTKFEGPSKKTTCCHYHCQSNTSLQKTYPSPSSDANLSLPSSLISSTPLLYQSEIPKNMLTSNQFSNSLIKYIDIISQSSLIISEASDIQIEFEFEED